MGYWKKNRPYLLQAEALFRNKTNYCFIWNEVLPESGNMWAFIGELKTSEEKWRELNIRYLS